MGKKKAHTRYRLKPTTLNPKGEIVPGVTTILDGQLGWNKRVLMAWSRREALKGNDPDLIARDAADSGTVAHLLVECYIKNEEPYLEDFTMSQIEAGRIGLNAFLDWEKENVLEYVELEISVVSEQYEYGGMIDMIARKNGALWLVDLKTSAAIYPEMKCQVAAYKQAYTEQTGKEIHECHLLQLSKKDASFQHHKLSNQQLFDAFEVFKHCRDLYRLQKQLK